LAPEPTTDHARSAGLSEFIVGSENRLVESAVQAILAGPPEVFNPLYVYGVPGAGKSHLLRGLAAAWKGLQRGTALYVAADDFARQLGDAQDTNGLGEFRQKYRGASLLAIDDVGRLAGKLTAQEELAATLDAALPLGNRVLVSGATSALQLPGFSPRLIGRLISGLSLPLVLPAAATRLVLLREFAAQRGLNFPEGALRLLAQRLEGSAWELAGAVLQLDTAARLDGQTLTVEQTQRYLQQRDMPRLPGVKEIAAATARHFALRLAELRSPCRRQAVVRARGVAMYLARHLTPESLEQIGRFFGGRDHTTVLHGCRKTEDLLKSEPAIHQAVLQLRQQLQTREGKTC
jgi:chromosomal replication initiator protein